MPTGGMRGPREDLGLYHESSDKPWEDPGQRGMHTGLICIRRPAPGAGVGVGVGMGGEDAEVQGGTAAALGVTAAATRETAGAAGLRRYRAPLCILHLGPK